MVEPNSEYPKNIAPALAELAEKKVKQASGEVKNIGAYALAIVNGEVDGLIGCDIFPDDGEGY